MADQLTYDEWIQQGRAIRKGQKARIYRVNPERTESRACFTLEQTQPLDREDISHWTIYVAAEDRPEAQGKRPKVKLAYSTTTRMLSVWVGNNAKAIKILQKNNFVFKPDGYRWLASRDGLEKTYDGFEAHGFTVEATLDGVPWEPQVAVV